MLLTETPIDLPVRKVYATEGEFISLPNVQKFYEFELPSLNTFDSIHLLSRSSAHGTLILTFLGRPNEDAITIRVPVPPKLPVALLMPALMNAQRIYIEAPGALDILKFSGVNADMRPHFAPAKFNYRCSLAGRVPHFAPENVVLPPGATSLSFTNDSFFTFVSPRNVCNIRNNEVDIEFRGAISYIVKAENKSILVTSENSTTLRPHIYVAPTPLQPRATAYSVKNEYVHF